MNPKLWWYLSRSTGIVAWVLLTASVVWGLLFSTKVLAGRPTPKWLLDLHRFLGALAVSFTGLHLATLVADSYTSFGAREILVPFASAWKPVPVAAGVVAAYSLVAVQASSIAMRRLPKRWWRAIHLTSFASFWMATLHGLAAGTDRTNRLLLLGYVAAAATVVFLTAYRLLADRRVPRTTAPRAGGADPHGASARAATRAARLPA
jgi:DMSO/TMAO reductase YedYZ heme-binding membrane subunit